MKILINVLSLVAFFYVTNAISLVVPRGVVESKLKEAHKKGMALGNGFFEENEFKYVENSLKVKPSYEHLIPIFGIYELLDEIGSDYHRLEVKYEKNGDIFVAYCKVEVEKNISYNYGLPNGFKYDIAIWSCDLKPEKGGKKQKFVNLGISVEDWIRKTKYTKDQLYPKSSPKTTACIMPMSGAFSMYGLKK